VAKEQKLSTFSLNDDYIKQNNSSPRPFIWTKPAAGIIRKVNRGRVALKMPALKQKKQLQVVAGDTTLGSR